jgi:hypothetical protein
MSGLGSSRRPGQHPAAGTRNCLPKSPGKSWTKAKWRMESAFDVSENFSPTEYDPQGQVSECLSKHEYLRRLTAADDASQQTKMWWVGEHVLLNT